MKFYIRTLNSNDFSGPSTAEEIRAQLKAGSVTRDHEVAAGQSYGALKRSAEWRRIADQWSSAELLAEADVTAPAPPMLSSAESYYDILEVPHDADEQMVKAAYRKQAMLWHPDKNDGSAESEARFKQIGQAYASLSQPDERARYDAALKSDATFRPLASVDPSVAAQMFMQEMLRMASELTFRNVPWRDIASELVSRGCPKSVAHELAHSVEDQRKAAVRDAAGRAFFQALLWCSLGVAVTLGSYAFAKPGGSYVVTSGLFVFGGFNLLRALFYLVSGRAP